MANVDVGNENSARIQLHYDDYGAGKPVVLIHGWPLSGRAWEAQVPALVDAGFRAITYDRRGFGESSKPWSGYDYDTFAADLDALLRHLDLHDVTLVGFSMGGGEVARYVGRYGTARVKKAVFAGAVPPFLYKSDENPGGGIDDQGIAGLEAGVRGDRLAFLEPFVKTFFSAKGELKTSKQQCEYARAIAAFASPKATLDCIGAFSRTDFRGDLEKVTIPTLVVHGDADAIVPLEVSGKLTAAAVPGAALVVIEGAPHGLNTTHAAEFNRALLAFLAS